MEQNIDPKSPIEPGPAKLPPTAWIIYLSLLSCVFLYALVGYVVRQSQPPEPMSELPIIIKALAVLSLFEAVLALFVFERIFKGQTDVMSFYILRWAMAESIAIYGLVVMILGGSIPSSAAFFAFSFALFMLMMPRR